MKKSKKPARAKAVRAFAIAWPQNNRAKRSVCLVYRGNRGEWPIFSTYREARWANEFVVEVEIREVPPKRRKAKP